MNSLAARRAAAANRSAVRRAARLARKLNTAPKKLAAAKEAYDQGHIEIASLIYLRLAASRPKNQYSDLARRRLEEIQDRARLELAQVDDFLQQRSEHPAVRPVETTAVRNERISAEKRRILEAFERYVELEDAYGRVPVVGKEIRKRIDAQKSRPEFAMVINDVEAKRLWILGQQHERDGHLCCAYQVYEQAAQLTPAPTAQFAATRVTLLSADESILESIEECNDLQWCHDRFRLALLVGPVNPGKAKALYSEIVARAPKDSRIYVTALNQLSGR